MKQFVGKTIVLGITARPTPIKGTVVRDSIDRVYLKGADGKIVRVIKSKIDFFTPLDGEPEEFIPVQVLHCSNSRLKCRGVQCMRSGMAAITNADYAKFMSSCPCMTKDCAKGTYGELRSVDPKFLASMLDGTMFGDYPEQQEK